MKGRRAKDKGRGQIADSRWRLRPIEAVTATEVILAELEARGMVTRPTRKGLTPFTPVKCRGKGRTASQIIIDDREDRF